MKRRSGFGFQTWKFQEPPKSFILACLRRIHAYLFIFHVLNLFKSWSNLQMGMKIQKRNQKMEIDGHKNTFFANIVNK